MSPRAQAKRQQITAAARQLFLAQGYARTTTEAIARAGGVSKQTLYAYFPGKVELLAAIVEQELADLEPGQPDQVPPQSLAELRRRLLGVAGAVTGRLLNADALALLRLLIGEAMHLPELRGLLRQAFPARILSTAERLLAAADHAGLIHAPSPELSARMFIGPVMSFIALDGLFSNTLPTPPDSATLARLVDLFLLTVAPGSEQADG
ncbi:TetR/AcrR family transcriptional regulator [Deinococcus frigens]|uniref:TetR/AcrR family transcriptional regulator n=1 Tax=Deinococcus frigens TaxID=249403 RepID=UPI00049810ED|nr:TetR/AcrR family transcriptional regulator [Deinococcus frigens]